MTSDAWPPLLPEAILKWMVAEANTYALTRGLCYLPSGSEDVPVAALHAPFTLFPTPMPKHLFDQAMRLQRIYNALYSQIACEVDILDNVLGDEVGVGRVDDFTGRLWRGWKNLRDQGRIRQVRRVHTEGDGTFDVTLSCRRCNSGCTVRITSSINRRITLNRA